MKLIYRSQQVPEAYKVLKSSQRYISSNYFLGKGDQANCKPALSRLCRELQPCSICLSCHNVGVNFFSVVPCSCKQTNKLNSLLNYLGGIISLVCHWCPTMSHPVLSFPHPQECSMTAVANTNHKRERGRLRSASSAEFQPTFKVGKSA